MSNRMEVTAENYKQHVEKLIREKVATVVWGGNATRVQEVFVFPEQYFCGAHVKKKIRDMICQYLLENKFAFSIVVHHGKSQREWTMPLEPATEPFISIRKECEDSWKKAKEFFDRKAKEEIENFASSNWRITVIKTDNSLYRQSIRQQLLSYPDYVISTTYANDWMYPVKYGEPYNMIHEDYQKYVEFVNMHVKHFFDSLKIHKRCEADANMYFEGARVCHQKYEPATKFMYYASMAVARDFALQMRKNGFEATLFPTYELSSYVEIGIKPYDGIPIYLEVQTKSQ